MTGSAADCRVSVIMPTYRQGWCIGRAVQSLLSQRFREWELLVMDDGSPDDTSDVILGYAADRRIRYFRFHENRGLGTALRQGLSVARGGYIAYLPSDDVYFPDHLSALVELLDREPGVYAA